MESFGLFDLFKSLLAPNGAENAPSNPESPPSAAEQPNPAPNAQTAEPPPKPAPPNAFLDFIHNHDERAKRTKKK